MSNSPLFILVLIIVFAVFLLLLFGPTLFVILRKKHETGRNRLIVFSLVCEFLSVLSLAFQAGWLGFKNPAGYVIAITMLVGILGAWIINSFSTIRSDVPVWLAFLMGYILSMFGVLVLVPMLVDFLVQTVFTIPKDVRQTPMLSIDLFLSNLYLTGCLFFAGRWSRTPKPLAPLLIALTVLVLTAYMRYSHGLYKPNVMPIWYEVSILLGVVLSFGIAYILLMKSSKSNLVIPQSSEIHDGL
jgi:hypothetical protein